MQLVGLADDPGKRIGDQQRPRNYEEQSKHLTGLHTEFVDANGGRPRIRSEEYE